LQVYSLLHTKTYFQAKDPTQQKRGQAFFQPS
jgi:hypothetical protein